MDKNNIYIRTVSGHRFYPQAEKPKITISDMIFSLCNMPRCAGHMSPFYSTGLHSVVMEDILSEMLLGGPFNPFATRMGALFHDGDEFVIADIPSPVKVLLPDYKKLQKKINIGVFDTLHINGNADWELIHKQDKILWRSEKILFKEWSNVYNQDVWLCVRDSLKAWEQCLERAHDNGGKDLVDRVVKIGYTFEQVYTEFTKRYHSLKSKIAIGA